MVRVVKERESDFEPNDSIMNSLECIDCLLSAHHGPRTWTKRGRPGLDRTLCVEQRIDRTVWTRFCACK